MNMKKTIAAVAACAVAVSAMATTISASADANTLTYNLAEVVKEIDAGKVNITSQVVQYNLTAGTIDIVLTLPCNIGWEYNKAVFDNTTITVTGYDQDAGKSFPAGLVYSTNIKDNNYYSNYKVTTVVKHDSNGDVVKDGNGNVVEYTELKVTLPVGTSSRALPSTSNAQINVNAVTEHTLSTWQGISAFNDHVTGTWTPIDKFSEATAKIGTTDEARPLFNNFVATKDHEVKYPFRSVLNASSAMSGTDNVLTYLEYTDGLNGTDKAYYNVKAVINDIIANYDDVTFTFNTATAYVFPIAKGGNGAYTANSWDTMKDANGNDVAADGQYMAFSQHLYNLYGDEDTTYVGYTTYDWNYSNLFAGALIINNGLSMSLSDTESFTFSKTGLSFNWADITDGANVNTYVTYLQTMQLATSVDWYWDSLTISYANTESEDVAPGEGVEAEEDVIEDEEVIDEEIVEDEPVEDEPVEDEEVVEDEVVEDEPVEDEEVEAPVENPTTGNAPIALAVIPVALAAAAVVAKKRK